MSKEHKNIARNEYRRFCEWWIKQQQSLLDPYLPNDMARIVLEYSVIEELDHFRMVIANSSKYFWWVYRENTRIAITNFVHDGYSGRSAKKSAKGVLLGYAVLLCFNKYLPQIRRHKWLTDIVDSLDVVKAQYEESAASIIARMTFESISRQKLLC